MAKDLDNPQENDFERGKISTFNGSRLGECNGFNLGTKFEDYAPIKMKILHSGNILCDK